MKVILNTYCVHRDSYTKCFIVCGAYEAAVLESVFGEGRVVRVETGTAEREVDVEMETPRLIAKYGIDRVKDAYPNKYESQIKAAIRKCSVQSEES